MVWDMLFSRGPFSWFDVVCDRLASSLLLFCIALHCKLEYMMVLLCVSGTVPAGASRRWGSLYIVHTCKSEVVFHFKSTLRELLFLSSLL